MTQATPLLQGLMDARANPEDEDLFLSILDTYIQNGVYDSIAVRLLEGHYCKHYNFTYYPLGSALTSEGTKEVFLAMPPTPKPPFVFYTTAYALVHLPISQAPHLALINSLFNHFSELKPLAFTYSESPFDGYVQDELGVPRSPEAWLDWFQESATHALSKWINEKRQLIRNVAFDPSEETQASSSTIRLCFNDRFHDITTEEAAGKTLRDLYWRYSPCLEVTSRRIARITCDGLLVPLDAIPVSGGIFRAYYAPEDIG